MNDTRVRGTERLRRPPIRTLKTVVLEVAAERLVSAPDLDALCEAVRAHFVNGARVVVVHGPGTPAMLARTAAPAGDQDDLADRVLSYVTRDVVNAGVVARLAADGLSAVGLSALDLDLVPCAHAGDHVASCRPTNRVDGRRVRRALEEGLVPVIAPIGRGPTGRPRHIAADALAQAVATAIGADALELDVGPRPLKPLDRVRAEALLGRPDLDAAARARLQVAYTALRQGVRDVRLGGLPPRE